MAVLSFFLVMWWCQEIDVFAASPVTYTLSRNRSVEHKGTLVKGSNDITFALPLVGSYEPHIFKVPDGCDKCSFTIFGEVVTGISAISGSGQAQNVSFSAGLSGYGLVDSSIGYSAIDSANTRSVLGTVVFDVQPGSSFSFNYMNLLVHSFYDCTASTATVYARFIPYANNNFLTFYSSSDTTGGVTRQDIIDQTTDLTTGFDSSQGDQSADRLGSEMNGYLQSEDALYDQMQYDVPELTLADDTKGILLASNFLQSLYVSDSFISQVVTYALTFGLILFIIGFLKKRGSG